MRDKLVLYVDERRELGQTVLNKVSELLLDDSMKCIGCITIPMNGGMPQLVFGRARATGLEEIVQLLEAVQTKIIEDCIIQSNFEKR